MANGTKCALILLACLFFTGCTDGATRLANDIEVGAKALQSSDKQTYVIQHVPEAEPEGCADSYKVQFSKESALVIWCIDSRSGEVTSSYITTYHLNFVKVPATHLLEKLHGESVTVELAREGNTIVVTNVH